MQGEKTNGLINILREENMKDEIVKKIIGDFVIAAGDTVDDFWIILLTKDMKLRFLIFFIPDRLHYTLEFTSPVKKRKCCKRLNF